MATKLQPIRCPGSSAMGDWRTCPACGRPVQYVMGRHWYYLPRHNLPVGVSEEAARAALDARRGPHGWIR